MTFAPGRTAPDGIDNAAENSSAGALRRELVERDRDEETKQCAKTGTQTQMRSGELAVTAWCLQTTGSAEVSFCLKSDCLYPATTLL